MEVDATGRLGRAGGAPSIYQTPWGLLDLRNDGKAGIMNAAQRSWLRRQWHLEPRGKDAASQDLLAVGEIRATTYRSRDHLNTKAGLRAVVGASLNHHAVTGLRRKVGRQEATIKCQCGLVNPGRMHWLWDCNPH